MSWGKKDGDRNGYALDLFKDSSVLRDGLGVVARSAIPAFRVTFSEVVEAPEGLRGDSATNVQKPAKLETGKMVQVPLFIKEGETIKIDTRTGAYMGRA